MLEIKYVDNFDSILTNSHPYLTGAWELRKLSCKLSILNSLQLPMIYSNSHFSTLIISCTHVIYPKNTLLDMIAV